jgi:two-component system phosphate regulon response regulator PhoB
VEAARTDAVVLDLMLPDMSGVEVCRRLRASPETATVPVLMLTARGDEYERLLGFEVGADDYVVKPFSVRELVHRVRSLTRRGVVAGGAGELLRWRGLMLDVARARVTLDDVVVELRPLEVRLLESLLRHPGRVLSRAELLRLAWGQAGDGESRTVDTHVRRLREALGAYGEAVETLRGFGYRVREE